MLHLLLTCSLLIQNVVKKIAGRVAVTDFLSQDGSSISLHEGKKFRRTAGPKSQSGKVIIKHLFLEIFENYNTFVKIL